MLVFVRVFDHKRPVWMVLIPGQLRVDRFFGHYTPVVLACAGVENVNAQVDDLIITGVLRRVLAFTELKFSNSVIEAWWRS